MFTPLSDYMLKSELSYRRERLSARTSSWARAAVRRPRRGTPAKPAARVLNRPVLR